MMVTLAEMPKRDSGGQYSTRWIRKGLFVCAGLLLWGAHQASAQGILFPLSVLRTGSGPSLLTERRIIEPTDIANAIVQFSFGFATDEPFGPGSFFDSVTASLQPVTDPTLQCIYFTADASGVRPVPPTPGTIPLAPDALTLEEMNYPSLQPVLTNQHAFRATVQIPEPLRGRSLYFYFDVFDNGNSLQSLAWLSFSPVPEPSVHSLWIAGLLALIWAHRRS